jgi:RsmE family RNA methyltransferase
MNLLLLAPEECGSGDIELDGRRARHLLDVLAVAPGRVLRAGIAGGALGHAEVVAATDHTVTVRFVATAAATRPLAIDLVVAMPRPKAAARILQLAATFAVRSLAFTRAWKVDKSYLDSTRISDREIHENLVLGCEQGESTYLPRVTRFARFMDMLQAIPLPTGAATLGIVAHARGGVAVEHAVTPGEDRPVTIAIGPEGGWIDREITSFSDLGFSVVQLGGPILRVESAVVAALAQVTLLSRMPADPRHLKKLQQPPGKPQVGE